MFIQREEKKTHQNKPVKIINLAWGTKVQRYCLIFLFVVRCLENRKHCFDFTSQKYFTASYTKSIKMSDYKDYNQQDEDDRDTISAQFVTPVRGITVFYTIELISLRF